MCMEIKADISIARIKAKREKCTVCPFRLLLHVQKTLMHMH